MTTSRAFERKFTGSGIVTHPKGDKGKKWWASQKEQRKLENEAILLKRESDRVTGPLLAISLRGKARGLIMACKTLQDLLRALPSSPTPAPVHPLPSLAPCFSLQIPLASGPLYLLVLCQEKTPWQLYHSLLTLFRSLLKCHHQRAIPDLVKGQPLPHAIIHLSRLTLKIFYLSFHSFTPLFIHSCLSSLTRDLVGFTAVSSVNIIVPGMW